MTQIRLRSAHFLLSEAQSYSPVFGRHFIIEYTVCAADFDTEINSGGFVTPVTFDRFGQFPIFWTHYDLWVSKCEQICITLRNGQPYQKLQGSQIRQSFFRIKISCTYCMHCLRIIISL